MHQVLVVANQTLGGDELAGVITSRIDEQPCEFWLLVPAPRSDPPHLHPTFALSVGAEIPMHVPEPGDMAAYDQAQQRLQYGLERLRKLGATVDGVVGGPNALEAIERVVASRRIDEIVISTLPSGISRWLHQDLPHRVERKCKLPVTVVTAPSGVG